MDVYSKEGRIGKKQNHNRRKMIVHNVFIVDAAQPSLEQDPQLITRFETRELVPHGFKETNKEYTQHYLLGNVFDLLCPTVLPTPFTPLFSLQVPQLTQIADLLSKKGMADILANETVKEEANETA
eukprot:TRINITY_DN3000_c0_g1_i5.p1 TRINITY_DN3000_c0_g1~~TRINITY_DN3000_c0_g1_i5.p1  ORF type:complete len:126 (+),score=20.93 TRINITY_DN3000_c0_g1_i5:437-814(+)